MTDKLPYFKFYPSDFLSHPAVMEMEAAAVGVYVKLLCVQWKRGSLPKDPARLARLGGVSVVEMEEVIWPQLAACFADRRGSLVNNRLEEERSAALAKQKALSDGGKRGAAKTNAKRGVADKQDGGQAGGQDGGQATAKRATTRRHPSDVRVQKKKERTTSTKSGGARVENLPVGEEADPAVEMRARFAPLVRDLLWRGSKVPANAPDAKWNLGRDLNVITEHFGGWHEDRIAELIEWTAELRDGGGLPGVEPGEPMTMARLTYQSEWDPEQLYVKAERAHLAALEKRTVKRPTTNPTAIQVELTREATA